MALAIIHPVLLNEIVACGISDGVTELKCKSMNIEITDSWYGVNDPVDPIAAGV